MSLYVNSGESTVDVNGKVHKGEAHAKKHRRSRNGCLTCRKRKKRCDERKPTCNTCERLRLPCQYPGRSPKDNEKFIASMGRVHSTTELPRDRKGYVPIDVAVQPTAMQQKHFPLHYSVSKSESPVDAKDHPVALGTPALTEDEVSPGPNLTEQATFGDFLSPMLFPADGPQMPKAEPFALFSPNDHQNLTALDELTEPFASAVYVTPKTDGDGNPFHGVMDKSIHLTQDGTSELVNVQDIGEPAAVTKADFSELALARVPNPSAGPTAEKFRSVYPELGENAVALFSYFRDKQSILMSVSPLNYFRSVFLAFSLRYRAIMYGILAWAAWHKGDAEELAQEYFDTASNIVRQETINMRSKEEILAALLVLASAKICSGDISAWRPYLVMAGETIHLHGGLTSFMESESVRWLLKNFAYHEILTSSSLSQPKLFSANDFELIFDQPSSAALPDTLCACCQPLFVILERINELTRSVRLTNRGEEENAHIEKTAEHIYVAAHDLEQRIWTLQPSHKILQHLSNENMLLQQTLFDVFKLVAVLHMYQSVLQVNAASISMRVVAHHLSNTMESLFGTMVEGILTFPLFILGISSTTKRERDHVVERFEGLEKRLSARNLTQARVLLQRVWEHDQQGKLHVDWNELVDRDGLHFCFC